MGWLEVPLLVWATSLMSVFSHLDTRQHPEEGTLVVHGEETPQE